MMNRRTIVKGIALMGGSTIFQPEIKNFFPRGNMNLNQEVNRKYSPPDISTRHPRLLIRANDASSGIGINVDELRMRYKDPAYKSWQLLDFPVDSYSSLLPRAMLYLIEERKEDAKKVFNFLKNNPFEFGEYTSAADKVYMSALAFDWIRNGMTQSEANMILPMLIKGGDFLNRLVLEPAINHNYTIVSLLGVTMVALATYGEGGKYTAKAREYLDGVSRLLEGNGKLLATFKAKGGVWTEGNHYTPYVVFESFLMTLKAFSTASNKDYFALIRDSYGDFVSNMPRFLMANFRPDLTLERIGDITQRFIPASSTMLPILGLLTSEVTNPDLSGQTRSFSNELINKYGKELVPPVYNWMMLTNYDAQLKEIPSYTSLPLMMRFSKGVYEHIAMRSKWGESGTLITTQSGWHFTDHQHFDKGSFLIYKNGALVVDAGAYSGMYLSSWGNYSTRTLAHNCVLVHDPDEKSYFNHKKVEIFPDGGQRDTRGFQSQESWQEYLRVKDENKLDTAKIEQLAFDQEFQYLKSNLTNAYPEQVVFMGRQLLYFQMADFLIVRDRVITGKPLKKHWLLHFQERPLVDNTIPTVGVTDYSGGKVVSVVAAGTSSEQLQKKKGKLFVRPILPDEKEISIIGGAGFEYYNRFVDKNFPPESEFPESRESGKWRMETVLVSAEEDTTFLHAIEISDSRSQKMVETGYIVTEGQELEGVHFRGGEKDYIGLFNSLQDADVNSDFLPRSVKYRVVSDNTIIHVITGMPGERKFSIIINGDFLKSAFVSEKGVIFFTDKNKGEREIEIKVV